MQGKRFPWRWASRRIDTPSHADAVVIATDVPLTGLSDAASAAPLQTKLTPYTSYVIGATLPGKIAPEASFRDTSEPYYYLRIDRRRRGYYAVFGGLDHKTGQVEQTDGLFDELEATLHGFLPDAKIDRRWSGQVTESHDGLPLIGDTARRQYVATGFSGNGITFGTLSAMMICGTGSCCWQARQGWLSRARPWKMSPIVSAVTS